MDDKTLEIKINKTPPWWMEWALYGLILGLFIGWIKDPTRLFYVGALTALLLYWNYRLFVIIRFYAMALNAMEYKKLEEFLVSVLADKQKDGTFQDSTCLNKEEDSEQQSTEGD